MASLAFARPICLGLVGLIASLSLAIGLILALGGTVLSGWQFMNADGAFCVLLSTLSLHLSDPRRPRRVRLLSILLAALVALLAGAVLIEHHFPVFSALDFLMFSSQATQSSLSLGMSPQTTGCFELLALAMILLQMPQHIAARLSDLLIFLLGLLVLIRVSEYLFGVLPIFGTPGGIRNSPVTLFSLLLLAQVALFRCAENNGAFSILLGRGIGSRIARLVSPILLVTPFLREVARARVVQATRLPANYATAMLASLAAMLAFALLLFIAWRIDGMEREIHDLSLRDELTGLYNLRGFHLLAEQALLLAQRSSVPFSVLFIDLDNLKQINDVYGHSVGSATLGETGNLLKDTFRETDVLGRIGGDEFAVAGQFSHAAIAVATQRLQEATALRNSHGGHRCVLSLSIGHVTSEPAAPESLRTLLSKADEAMYEEKRRKKSAKA